MVVFNGEHFFSFHFFNDYGQNERVVPYKNETNSKKEKRQTTIHAYTCICVYEKNTTGCGHDGIVIYTYSCVTRILDETRRFV